MMAIRSQDIPPELLARVGRSAARTRSDRPRATLPQSRMNKWEQLYAQDLRMRTAAGEVAWFGFEPIKFRLAGKTFYTPDFMVVLTDMTVEFHEVKGFMRDDAAVKLKVVAEHFPFVFRLVTKAKGESGWSITTIGQTQAAGD